MPWPNNSNAHKRYGQRCSGQSMPGPPSPHCFTYRASVAREVDGVEQAELARVVDCAAVVTIDGLKTEPAWTPGGEDGGGGVSLAPDPSEQGS